ncbi:MAG: hypothetical protein R3345_07840 [Fulvivirga sp.]|nr:hypothetical protein [Fulvivirga sp.]
MQKITSVEEMSINPETIVDEAAFNSIFSKYQSRENFVQSLELKGKLNLLKTAKYIVLLYSEDSVLNERPPLTLKERQIKALKMAGFKLKDNKPNQLVEKCLIQLQDRHIFEFIFEFLKRNKRFVWQEIISLESQMLENQQLRMRPVAEEKGAEELRAFERKDKLTEMYKRWEKELKAAYNEFYGDNENVRAIHTINRENMALLENLAW